MVAAEVAHVAELEAAIEAVRLGLAEGLLAANGDRELALANDLGN